MFSIPRTPLDFDFTIFNVPVYVNATFWLTAALISWNVSGGQPAFLVMAMLCIFVSILVHELGHALANMYFNYHSQIALYYMGGLATTQSMPPHKHLVVSLAGPAAGFTLYGLCLATLYIILQYRIEIHPLLYFALQIMLYINLLWNLLNLIPVSPLDGGQALRDLFTWHNNHKGPMRAAFVSFLIAIPLVIWLSQAQYMFFAIFVAMGGFQSYQEWQQRRGRGF